MANTSKYIDQWDRVTRWFQRFKEISEGREHIHESNFYQDDVFAFFLNCYHLKDWIKNDPSAGRMSNLVEDYINKCEALSICADLCNGLKHLTLEKSRSGQYPEFGAKTHRLTLGTVPTRISIGYLIVTDKKQYDAFELAEQCILDWESFIYLNRSPA
jgi:hypothetical protein